MATTSSEKVAFPVCLDGHTLKYEIECICKIFLPMTRFSFFYDTSALPKDAAEGVILTLEELENNRSRFFVMVRLQGKSEIETAVLSAYNSTIEKSLCEYQFSAMLFHVFQKLTGQKPAWGLLTGIRPVKKIQPLLRAGLSKLEIMQQMQEKYWVTPEKIALTYETACVQEPLLQTTPMNSVGLYISIPFCPTRCSYCSFVSHSVEKAHQLISAYVNRLCEELSLWGEMVRQLHLTVDTIYFGGGTPTALTVQQLAQLLDAVQKNFDLSSLREYCVEAGRPDTITREKLETLRSYGVSRISVNPQTMQNHVLEAIGRKHMVQQTLDAYALAREVGFNNINMDLIAGLPTDTPMGFHDTLNQILELEPDSITIHSLTLKRAANLFAQGKTQMHNSVHPMVQESMTRLPEQGYAPYYMYRQKNTVDNQENVGYARKGKESLYNILIMDESQSIFGAGCGASTKIIAPNGKITRIHNYKFPYEYLEHFDKLMEKKVTVREKMLKAMVP
ncbi:MAG: coproporphyrinogen dehydrogenase HemZ [Ruminococcus sp.]|nr:coproporphyrinogen dehydrogenase HemZ [Ruminococcus sp.]